MKKVTYCGVAFGLLACLGGSAGAGGIDYLSNQSALYIGSFSRNGAVGSDSVVYNPAGTAWLSDGLYLNLNLQSIFKDFTITYKDEEYVSDLPTPLLPTFFAVWKWRDLAVFASFTVPAGGGSLEYEKGVPYLEPLGLVVAPPKGADGKTPTMVMPFAPTNTFFEGASMYLAPSLGVAYRFLDIFSISASGRLVVANKSYYGYADYATSTGSVTAKLDAKKSALGFGAVFGLHVSPIKQLHIGLRYELQTALEFETSSTLENIKTEENALWSYADGAKERRDLPAVLSAGIVGHPIPDLTLSASFTYYFNEQADDGDDVTTGSGYTVSYHDDYENGFDIAGSVGYQIIPELQVTLGYNRTVIGGNEKTYNDFEFAIDSHSFGFNARISALSMLDFVVSFSTTLYDEAKNETLHGTLGGLYDLQKSVKPDWPASGTVEAETFAKTAFAIALGVEWKVF